MFNWKNWQKSLASLVMLVGVGVVTYGDFSVGQGVAPDTDFKDLHTGEEVVVKEEKPVNEVLARHRQSEGYDLISAEHREQKEFERLEEIRIEEERIAKEKAEEEARLAEEARIKAEEEARIKAEEEARIKAEEEARIKAEAEKKKQQEQQIASSTSQTKQEQPKQEKPKQEKPKQEKPKQAPQERRTDGFNFHNYHFSVKSWGGNGEKVVPMETNNVFQWATQPTHYLVERISPAGRVIQQLGMGDTVVLNGKSYVVTHIKRTVPNDGKSRRVLNSVSADITIQTCETTKGANGKSDLTLWYLQAQ